MPSGPSIGRTALVGALAHTVNRRLEWLELALSVDLPVIEAGVPLELSSRLAPLWRPFRHSR